MTQPITLYRYDDGMDYQHLTVRLRRFYVLRETPKGYWVVPQWSMGTMLDQEALKRWVAKRGRKRLCYPTQEEAWESYRRRKEMHRDRLRHQLDLTERRVNGLEAGGFDAPPGRDETPVAYHGMTMADY